MSTATGKEFVYQPLDYETWMAGPGKAHPLLAGFINSCKFLAEAKDDVLALRDLKRCEQLGGRRTEPVLAFKQSPPILVLVGVSAILFQIRCSAFAKGGSMGLFGLPVFHAAVREHGCKTRVRGDVKRRPGQKLTAAVSESVMYRSCSCVAAEYNGIFGSTAPEFVCHVLQGRSWHLISCVYLPQSPFNPFPLRGSPQQA